MSLSLRPVSEANIEGPKPISVIEPPIGGAISISGRRPVGDRDRHPSGPGRVSGTGSEASRARPIGIALVLI